MIGSWRWNVSLGVGGSLLTLLFSLGSNGLGITSLRCLYAFAAFFVLTFFFRALVAFSLKPSPSAALMHSEPMEPTRGHNIDYSTPEEDEELKSLLKNQMDSSGMLEPDQQHPGFKPLSPPKLVSTQNKEPEELAKAIRHLTGG
ncbi:hypothetical protein [Paenibacillus sp. R14(2021)]|uniref:hypothetical protein n=1 Tax=Paenibacillus sp. R14(2021) TaxID=2859228 RepID=UPI001C61231D|nr:hypothetical protein [Paenibacillus sp. R14(2021)]